MVTRKSDGNAKETHKDESNSEKKYTQLTEQRDIPDTPFKAIKYENKWFVALGNYKLSPILESFEECQENIKDVSWERLISIMQIMIEINNKKLNN